MFHKIMDTETIRQSYRPDHVRLLLVGESPPSKGKFFYVKSAMTTFTSRPFEEVFGVKFRDNKDFLEFFKDKQCFLEDLCHEPVDNLTNAAREEKLQASISRFSQTLKELNPEVVAIVLRKIEVYVNEAIEGAELEAEVYTLPFPGNGHQNRYMSMLKNIIEEHLVSET